MKCSIFIASLVIFLVTTSNTCKQLNTSGNIYRTGQYITLDQLADSLKNEFDIAISNDSVLKYAFVIKNKTNSVSRQAGTENNNNTIPFTIDSRYNLASVTKTITAVALLQLIEKKGLSLGDEIWPYLPKNWTIPNNVKRISFQQILMHNSGFVTDPPDETYENARITIANDVRAQDIGKHDYKNINYGICRILIAYLDGYFPGLEVNQGKATSDRFMHYVQSNIFDRINIRNILFKPDIGKNPVLFYNLPYSSNDPGYGGGDWTLKPGSAGIFLSMNDLSQFLNSLSAEETILSNNMKVQMNSRSTLMGWDDAGNFQGDNFLYKGGYLPPGNAKSAIYIFQNGLQISVIWNGVLDSPDYVYEAYRKAWAHSKTPGN